MKHIFTFVIIGLWTITSFCQSGALVVSEDFENAPIEQVFNVLKTKYALQVAYDYQDVTSITVDQTIDDLPLDIALQKIFSNTGLEHQLKDNRILIRKISEGDISTTYTIKKRVLIGKVIDDATNSPLEFATVYSKEDNQGIMVSSDGTFELEVASNKTQGELVIQHLGYVPKIHVWEDKASKNKLTIRLQAKPHKFDPITVTGRLPTLTTSKINTATTLHTDKLNTLPAFVGGTDVLRNIQLLPGIGADDDLSAEIKVRGSNGDENMIVLNGITLYKVDHYFGVFSAVNHYSVDQVNIYKNAFPAQYGGRTGSVIEFITDNNINTTKKITGGAEINLLTSSAYVSLPIGKKMEFQVTGRITNTNVASTSLFSLLNQEVRSPSTQNFSSTNDNTASDATNTTRGELLAYEPNFKFYDINAKWAWQLTPSTNFSLSYFRGYDDLNYNYSQEYTVGRKNRERTSNVENYAETSTWLNNGISGKLEKKWSKAFNSELLAAYSGLEDELESTLSFHKVRLNRRGEVLPRTADSVFFETKNSNEIYGLDINLKNTIDIDKHQQATFGYNYLKNDLTVQLNVDGRSILNNLSSEAQQHALYGQYHLTAFEDKWNFEAGLRATHYSITNELYWSPRLSVWYQAHKALQFKASWSHYYQFLHKNYYEDRFGRTSEFWVLGNERRFPISSSTNWMVGFNHKNKLFELDVEAYIKDTDGITEYAQTNIGLQQDPFLRTPESYQIFRGKRLTKGIDFLLKKDTKNYSGWLAYTLSKSTNSFNAIRNGAYYPSRDDRRHQLKFVNQYRYKKFDFSATYIYSSGRPYTNLSNFTSSPSNRGDVRQDQQISYLSSYQRVDVGVNYRFNLSNAKANIGFSIFNLFNRQNVKYRQYILSVNDPDPTPGQNPPRNSVLGTELQMMDFTPNFTFSIDF